MVKRAALSALAGIGLAAVVLLLMGSFDGPVTYHGTYLAPPMPAADFTLRSADGPVSRSDLEGQVVVMFFGYTSCPDVCPTTLLRLNTALDEMEARGMAREDVQVLFVSVDPERDTPERATAYARAVHPSFLGVTGAEEEIAPMAAQYGIYYARAEGSEATGYLVDHSASVVVLNQKGEMALLWSHSVTAPQLAEDLTTMLGG